MSNVRSFTPELGNYKPLQPFRYWCQKVLPLVYDDSLSYYELLGKVVDYLNKTMEDVETLHGDVTNLHAACEELQSYVNNYFSALDVQEEINNKLDEMSKNGFFNSLLNGVVKNGENNSITMNMLSQEVKEAMTGGSVPVVGVDAVSTDNVQNDAINVYKIYECIDNGSVKPNSPIVHGNYQSSDGLLHFIPESDNVLLAVPVEYGEKYTIYRTILSEFFTLVEITGEFIDLAPANFVYNLGTNGWNGYFYTPTSENVKYLVVNIRRAGSEYTVQQLFEDLHIIKGNYMFNAFAHNDYINRAYKFDKPKGYGVTLSDVYELDRQAWAEGVLGAGETFKLKMPLDVPNNPSNNPSNYSDSLSNMKYSNLIELYDTLPTQLDKTIIGYATQNKEQTEPDYNYPIYMWRCRSSAGNAKNSFGIKPLNILLTAGVHGEEKGAPYSMFKLMQIMLDKYYNSMLREAYMNINIDFIPVVNPWGFDHETRENARGVNLNRNFSYNWNEYTGGNKGTAPLSEIESSSVAQLISENKYDYIIDWHEANLTNGTYVSTQNPELAKVHIKNCRKMYTSSLTRWGLFVINGEQGVAELNTIPSLANEMLATDGINNGLIYEQAWGFEPYKWTSRNISQGVEMYANLLIEYARRFNGI